MQSLVDGKKVGLVVPQSIYHLIDPFYPNRAVVLGFDRTSRPLERRRESCYAITQNGRAREAHGERQDLLRYLSQRDLIIVGGFSRCGIDRDAWHCRRDEEWHFVFGNEVSIQYADRSPPKSSELMGERLTARDQHSSADHPHGLYEESSIVHNSAGMFIVNGFFL